MYFVDHGESFSNEYLVSKSASIQPRTSPLKFATALRIGSAPPHEVTADLDAERALRAEAERAAAASAAARQTAESTVQRLKPEA